MKRVTGFHAGGLMLDRRSTCAQRRASVALSVLVGLGAATAARASIETRVRHTNMLLAQHPAAFDFLGFATTEISVAGGELLLLYDYALMVGYGPLRESATVADLTGQLTTILDPRLRCRVGPPFVDQRGSDCLTQQLRVTDGAEVTFDLDDPAAEFLIMAVEDLVGVLKAREDALR